MNGTLRGAAGLATLMWAFLLGGCVLGTRNPTLTYPPSADSSAVSAAHAAEKPLAKNVQIVLEPFDDERSDQKTVGTTRNAFGMRMADVVPRNNVADWVTRAMKTELENNGYTVIDGKPGASASGAGVVVSGSVLNVFCDMYISYTGQVSLLVRLSKDGQSLLDRHYSGEGSAGLAIAATSESYSRSLALALSAALQRFVSDLNKTVAAGQ